VCACFSRFPAAPQLSGLHRTFVTGLLVAVAFAWAVPSRAQRPSGLPRQRLPLFLRQLRVARVLRRWGPGRAVGGGVVAAGSLAAASCRRKPDRPPPEQNASRVGGLEGA